MLLTIKLIIFLGAIAIILAPYFWKKKGEAEVTPEALERRSLQSQKEVAYAALRDLDFDFQMGKLSEADYRELRKSYEDKAIRILKDLDNLNQNNQKLAVQA